MTWRGLRLNRDRPGTAALVSFPSRLTVAIMAVFFILNGWAADADDLSEGQARHSPLVAWRSALMPTGLPAYSARSGQVAIAVSPSSLESVDEIQLLDARSGDLITAIRPLDGLETEPDQSSYAVHAGQRIAALDVWLRLQGFASMQSVYTVRELRESQPGTWTSLDDRWLIDFDWASTTLRLFDSHSQTLRLQLQRPWETLAYLKQPGVLCAGRGIPSELWTDVSGRVIVVRTSRHFSSGHYCAAPDHWLVRFLPEQGSLIEMAEDFEPPLRVDFRPGSTTSPVMIKVGTPHRIEADHSPGESVIYRWRISRQPEHSGTLLFDAYQGSALFIADRAGHYEVEVFVTSGRYESEAIQLEIVASGTLEAATWIGPNGGGVALADGAAILVPPGAVDRPVRFSIEPLDETDAQPEKPLFVGPLYDLQPEGIEFHQPVLLIIPIQSSASVTASDSATILLHRHDSDGHFGLVGSSIGSALSHSQDIDQDRQLIRWFTKQL